MTSSRTAASSLRMDVLLRASHSAHLPLLPRYAQRRHAADLQVSSSGRVSRHPLLPTGRRSDLVAAGARQPSSCRASFNGFGRRSSRSRDERSHAHARAEGGMWQGGEGEERGRRDAGRSASGGAGPAWMGMGAGGGGARAGMGDVQRLLIGGAVLAAVTWLKFATEGHLGWLGDGALEGVAQLWFVFYLLDLSLTTATWIVGKLTSTLAVANCPWCDHQFTFDRNAMSHGAPVCPSCLRSMKYEDGQFQQGDGGRSGFSAQSRSQGQQGWRATGDTVVDVEATIIDKE
ncbi:hypothetical protein CLOM_g12201 [Closterium sp. NIES-68]|nr:hypothetical protein CLOM_g12201 [Closterium sp. NIES-68]